jgi:hypothetical protein
MNSFIFRGKSLGVYVFSIWVGVRPWIVDKETKKVQCYVKRLAGIEAVEQIKRGGRNYWVPLIALTGTFSDQYEKLLFSI